MFMVPFLQAKDCSSFCFFSLCPLVNEAIYALCKIPDGKDWWWVELSPALVLSKTLIHLSADG